MTDQVQQEPSVSDMMALVPVKLLKITKFLQFFAGDRKNNREFIEDDKQAGESGAAEKFVATSCIRQHRIVE